MQSDEYFGKLLKHLGKKLEKNWKKHTRQKYEADPVLVIINHVYCPPIFRVKRPC